MGEDDGEGGHASEGVHEQCAVRGKCLTHEPHHLLRLGVVHLEEGRLADDELVAAELFEVGPLAGRKRKSGQRREDERAAGIGREAHLELVEPRTLALEERQKVVHGRLGDRAVVHLEESPSTPADESHVAELAPGGEAHVVAVGPRVRGADDRAHDRVVDVADAAKLLADDRLLRRELRRVVHVLELAAAALAEERAGRLDARLRRLEHLRRDRVDVVALDLLDRRLDQFTLDGVGDEDDAPVLKVADARAAEDDRPSAQRKRIADERRLVGDAFLAAAASRPGWSRRLSHHPSVGAGRVEGMWSVAATFTE